MAPYRTSGPISCVASIDTRNIQGKTAIVTGGALGIGEAYVRALAAAGAHVVIADLNSAAGGKLHQEFSSSTTFIECDVTSWQSQISVFKKARDVSPTQRIDIVVANAGISNADQVFSNDVASNEPEEPKLKITDVNVIGVLLTTKLALWYFRKQNATGPKQDQCLVLQGSVTGYVDHFGAPQYTLSKYAVRGLMRSLRQSEQAYGIRVNQIAPWYVRTSIITSVLNEAVEKSGAGYATLEDAGQALLRIVSDGRVHGRSIAVMPRTWDGAPNGYMDLDQDDLDEKTQPWMYKMQQDILKPVSWIEHQRGIIQNVY